MVLRTAPSSPAMATSDQPVKKKLRIDAPDIDDGSDRSAEDIFESDSPPTECTAEYPPRPGDSPDSGTVSEDAVDCAALLIHPRNLNVDFLQCDNASCSNGENLLQDGEQSEGDIFESDLKVLQDGLVVQCLCHVETAALIRPFDRRLKIATWPVNRTLKFLSTTQLLFDVYLKQNNSGTICSRIMHACDTLVRNQYDWVTELVELSDNKSKFVVFVASKVLSSFLIVAKDTIDQSWLQQIVENVYLFDTFNRITVQKINFSLDIIKRIVEWKNFEQHPLEDSQYVNTANRVDGNNPFRSQTGYAGQSGEGSNVPSTSTSTSGNSEGLQNAFSNLNTQSNASTSTDKPERQFKLQEPVLKLPSELQVVEEPPPSEESNEAPAARLERLNDQGCVTVVLTDSESFDTSYIKCLTIKTLQHHWSALVKNVKLLLVRYLNLSNSENCILTFFELWENIISVKANLSVIDTKPFYADLQSFVDLLRSTNMPHLIYKQLLSLFNEVLCYGSTLALQDILPEEICTLAHAIVRYVKDFRLLSDIQITNSRSGFNFIGSDSPMVRNYSLGPEVTNGMSLVDQSYDEDDEEESDRSERSEVDKTMLQKISLLVLKSVAVTVKEMRCDSSDSSIDSSDYNAIQDMQIVERSIRDVLKKVDVFIKNSLEFHPETPFTKMLVHLFSEQDDYLIESMVCTLDITVGIVYRNSVYPDLMPMLNPIVTFIEFLKVVSHDSDVLLDYLVSNETCFLLYLLRFLKYVRRNWSKFLEWCQASDAGNGTRGLDDTMSVLIRLRLQISRLVSRSLFPYNISPVLRLLEVCESLYEGNELS